MEKINSFRRKERIILNLSNIVESDSPITHQAVWLSTDISDKTLIDESYLTYKGVLIHTMIVESIDDKSVSLCVLSPIRPLKQSENSTEKGITHQVLVNGIVCESIEDAIDIRCDLSKLFTKAFTNFSIIHASREDMERLSNDFSSSGKMFGNSSPLLKADWKYKLNAVKDLDCFSRVYGCLIKVK
ncbi:MAG: hypothetical protein ACRC5M_07205 [Anaeroplasmataceae bacterium]